MLQKIENSFENIFYAYLWVYENVIFERNVRFPGLNSVEFHGIKPGR